MKANVTRWFRHVCVVLPALVLGGCAANGYSQFFTSTLPVASALADSTLVRNTGEPELYSGTQLREDNLLMQGVGYALIGYSRFDGPPTDPASALTQARAVHAAIVLHYARNPRAVTDVVPVFDMSFVGEILNPRAETTSTSGTVHGADGSVDYQQTTTKTVPREKATPQTMPVTSTRYDHLATYWARTRALSRGTPAIVPSAELNSAIVEGLWTGGVANSTVGLEATLRLALHTSGNELSGSAVIGRPLSGSGPIVGVCEGGSLRFMTHGEGALIEWKGDVSGSGLTGSYRVVNTGEVGTWRVAR